MLHSDKDVSDYIVGMGIEVGSVFFQKFDTHTQLIVELHDKITAKQLRKIELRTGTAMDSLSLRYNPIHDHHSVDLVFKK
jgi:hypothetical protein